MVLEHQHERGSQWAAIRSIDGKIGCTAQTLRKVWRQLQRGGFVVARCTAERLMRQMPRALT